MFRTHIFGQSTEEQVDGTANRDGMNETFRGTRVFTVFATLFVFVVLGFLTNVALFSLIFLIVLFLMIMWWLVIQKCRELQRRRNHRGRWEMSRNAATLPTQVILIDDGSGYPIPRTVAVRTGGQDGEATSVPESQVAGMDSLASESWPPRYFQQTLPHYFQILNAGYVLDPRANQEGYDASSYSEYYGTMSDVGASETYDRRHRVVYESSGTLPENASSGGFTPGSPPDYDTVMQTTVQETPPPTYSDIMGRSSRNSERERDLES